MWQDLGLCLYPEVYYCPLAACPDLVETAALDVWTKLLGKCICFQAVAPCLCTDLKTMMCLLVYYCIPSAISRSLALQMTLNQMSRPIAIAVTKLV